MAVMSGSFWSQGLFVHEIYSEVVRRSIYCSELNIKENKDGHCLLPPSSRTILEATAGERIYSPIIQIFNPQ